MNVEYKAMRGVYNLFGVAVSTSASSGLVAEDVVVGREEDLRHLEMAPRVLLHCDGCFRRWSSSGEVYNGETEAGQSRQR